MEAVILFSHGSLLCGAGLTLEDHAARMRRRLPELIIEIGYLNYSDPSFIAAVEACRTQGASHITVLPYFLAPGYFVSTAMPKCIQEAQSLFPSLIFQTANPVGYDPLLADVILESANQARPQSLWYEDRERAFQRCRKLSSCPLFSVLNCSESLSSNRTDSILSTPQLSDFSIKDQSESFRDAALLVLVHGSPKAGANDDFLKVLEEIKLRKLFHQVQEGYLECNEPAIPEAIDLCANSGVKKILVIPYFLHTGKHVVKDLPELLSAGASRHPDLDLLLGDFIGRSSIITDILTDRLLAVDSASIGIAT